MEGSSTSHFAGLEAVLPYERERLVRLYARVTGDPDTAEDLAQETLVEAWRNAHKLYDTTGYSQWLSAIARNITLRWTRSHGRELAAHAAPPQTNDSHLQDPLDTVADNFDIEVELEREELAELLDRAMASLPMETRDLLIERYIQEAPVTQIAERLRLTEGAVTMRLQRGKLHLRHMLTTELQDEAAAYGIAPTQASFFEITRIWCPLCGQQRLQGCFEPVSRMLKLRCPLCTPEPNTSMVDGGDARLFAGIQGYRPALKRLMIWGNDLFTRGIRDGSVPCPKCQQPVQVQTRIDTRASWWVARRNAFIQCSACGEEGNAALSGLALCLPEVQRFWTTHPRIHAIPDREIEVAGRPTLVSSFQNVKGHEHIDVLFEANTFRVLNIHQYPAPRS